MSDCRAGRACWIICFLVLTFLFGTRSSSAQDVIPLVDKPTEAYRRACELVDLCRPEEALAAIGGDTHPYSIALKASLFGNPDNREWGLSEIRVDEAQRLAKSVLTTLEQRAQDDGEAPYLLGRLYATGIGVAKDPARAVRFYQLAANRDHAFAVSNLGVHYYHGDGVAKDLTEARKLWQRAGRRGSVNAQFNLGLCYDLGHGIKENKRAAEHRFKIAARKGHTDAMQRLAVRELDDAIELLEKKKEAPAKKALERCRKLLEESAEAGNSHSMYSLGELHRRRLFGEKKDWPTAMKWYQKAARLGHRESKAIVEALEKAEVVVLAWSWHADAYGFVHAKGQVRNATDVKLEGVQAIVSFFTDDGTFIASDSAFLEFNPLMPGQTSPFEVIAQYNPRMKSARLEFGFFAGRKLRSFSLDLD